MKKKYNKYNKYKIDEKVSEMFRQKYFEKNLNDNSSIYSDLKI